MDIYLVGGAVRDELLGLDVFDRDFVVVGCTPQKLKRRGFIQVGKDFPVFLHPETKEEYALARRERKIGVGYTGFVCDFSPDISLEEDLIRRDLTINAIAKSKNNELIDPLNGLDDLKNKVLKHCSSAFSEDPLRVLRVARFYAKLHHLGFKIAPETFNLMRAMVNDGILAELSLDRVSIETRKAFLTQNPEIYFETLDELGTLNAIFYPLTIDYIPREKLIKASKLLEKENDHRKQRLLFALLITSLMNEDCIEPFCKKLRIPKDSCELGLKSYRYLNFFKHLESQHSQDIVNFFNSVDAFRKKWLFEDICTLMTIVFEENKEKIMKLQADFNLLQTIENRHIIEDGFQNSAIREELNRRRIELLEKLL